MKKSISFLLFLTLLVSACAFALADDAEDAGIVNIPYSGITFATPESMMNTRGVVLFYGYGFLTDYTLLSTWLYIAAPENELTSVAADDPRITPLFYILTVCDGKTVDDLNADYSDYFRADYLYELGKEEDTTFYLYMEPPYEDFLSAVSGTEYGDEYSAFAAMTDEISAAITCSRPVELPEIAGNPGEPDDAAYEALIGTKAEFTTTDLDGNPVSSADLFAQNEITMVNIWATWCPPCIGELAGLQEISERLGEKNCGVVGLLLDDDLETAKSLLADNGVAYPVIRAPENVNDMFISYFVPDTYFVDSEGTILAVPVVGAYLDQYEPAIEALLRK